MQGIEGLVQRWRDHARLLRQYGSRRQAAWLEHRAAEVEAAQREQDCDLLTLTEAAAVCGYSPDHLGRLLRQGKLRNHGRSNAPRVRRVDLPRKPSLSDRSASANVIGASRRQVAQAITTSGTRR